MGDEIVDIWENEFNELYSGVEEMYEGELNLDDYDRIPEDIRASMEC